EFCPVCGIRFEHETGFFWGAMYISYTFSTGLMIFAGILGIAIYEVPFMYLVIGIFIVVVLTCPYSFRYSRMIMLYGISPYKFDPEAYKGRVL
ncbi:MAG: DUF983 domain-containing protein, partial [Bacteroidia bacterium]|nr:DUF983 domain-containing protein [Bacteroidia bacterium]